MPALKPYSQWDYWWVVKQTTIHKQRLRHPPRLGVRRSFSSKLANWWQDNAWAKWTAGGIAFLAFFVGTFWIGRNTVSGWYVLTLFILLAAVAVTIVSWKGNGIDGRCIAASHRRVRCARKGDSVLIAKVVFDRRRAWSGRIEEAPRQLRSAIMLQSVAWRRFMIMYLFLMMSGPLLGPLAQFISPVFASAAPVRYGSGLVLYQQVAMLGFVATLLLWQRTSWSRIRKRLNASLAGTGCPDCGYEVNRGPLVAAETGLEVVIGPARCSECGCPWPLIPSDPGIEPDRWEWRR